MNDLSCLEPALRASLRTDKAEYWKQLYKAVRLVTPPPFFAGGAIGQERARLNFGSIELLTSEAGVLCLSDADVLGYGLVRHRDQVLTDRNLTMPLSEIGLYGYFADVQIKANGKLDFSHHYRRSAQIETGVLLLRRGDTIHGHWLLEVLPKIVLALESNAERAKYIVSSAVSDYQLQMIHAFGIEDHDLVRIGANDVIRCERLLIPSVAHTNELWLHPFANLAYDHLVQNVNMEAIEKDVMTETSDCIFVTRSTRLNDPRPLINSSQIEDIASAAGFQIIDPGLHSWREQIRFFSEAKCIVGLSGSGMHNTVFTGGAARVMVLQPNQNNNFLQSSIAAVRGHGISYLLGESTCGFDSATWETGYIIDPILFSAAIDLFFR